MPKRNLMHGEMDSLPTLDQLSTTFREEQFQMDTLSTTVSFLILSLRPTLMLKPLDKLPLMPKRNLMHGEMDSLLTLDQLSTTFREEQFQMDTLSTTVSFLILSLRLTLMLKLPDKLPLMPKKNLMLGETDSLPTLDQLSTMLNTKIC
jgi:hypothetical protein